MQDFAGMDRVDEEPVGYSASRSSWTTHSGLASRHNNELVYNDVYNDAGDDDGESRHSNEVATSEAADSPSVGGSSARRNSTGTISASPTGNAPTGTTGNAADGCSSGAVLAGSTGNTTDVRMGKSLQEAVNASPSSDPPSPFFLSQSGMRAAALRQALHEGLCGTGVNAISGVSRR